MESLFAFSPLIQRLVSPLRLGRDGLCGICLLPVFSFPGSLEAANPRRLRHRLWYEIDVSLSPKGSFVKQSISKTTEEHFLPFLFLKS
jgi:hypothetical protein